MATPLTDSINALTAYANEITGGSDTNLSDAVHTLASGYGGGSEELITIPENNLTNSTNLDAFLETIIQGWNTEFIFLGYKEGGIAVNGLLGCFSNYANTQYSGLSQVWRAKANGGYQNNASRNGGAINVAQGSVYRVIRNPFTIFDA